MDHVPLNNQILFVQSIQPHQPFFQSIKSKQTKPNQIKSTNQSNQIKSNKIESYPSINQSIKQSINQSPINQIKSNQSNQINQTKSINQSIKRSNDQIKSNQSIKRSNDQQRRQQQIILSTLAPARPFYGWSAWRAIDYPGDASRTPPALRSALNETTM